MTDGYNRDPGFELARNQALSNELQMRGIQAGHELDQELLGVVLPCTVESRVGDPELGDWAEVTKDDRRVIYESVGSAADGTMDRRTQIIVTGNAGPLGNHWHTFMEGFQGRGAGRLITHDLITGETREQQLPAEGYVVFIPPGMVHTFVVEPSAELYAYTDAMFVKQGENEPGQEPNTFVHFLETQNPNLIFVPQTGTYASYLGEREYLTTHDPRNQVPAFTRFAEEAAYAEVISAKVGQCVDIMIYDEDSGRFLIGARNQEPHSGDWVVGGAMRAGESVADSAAHAMGRELGLELDKTRLREVGNYKFIWDSREQAPTQNEAGQPVTSVHQSATLVVYPVRHGEVEPTQLVGFSDARWVDPFEIIDAPAGTYHPALVDMARDTLDVLTAPEPPATAEDADLRDQIAIALAKARIAARAVLAKD